MNYIRRTSLAAALALASGMTSTAVHAALKDGLVAHLAFDGNATDASTKANNGTAVGEPTYAAGQLGQAVFCSNAKDGSFANFITLGTAPDVLFGDATDFSVAMWVQLNAFSGDAALFGNKSWNSGGNLGFVLATDNDRRVQWNYKEEATPRQDFDSSGGQLLEGKWVHVAMTVKRDGKISTYINGQLLNAKDARPAGAAPSTIDTDAAGLAMNIGNDGTGAYTDNGSVSHGNTGIDDFGLWRRETSASEVARIYTSGLEGVSLTKIVEPTIAAIGTQSPAPNALNVAPLAPIEVVINHLATAVNPASVKLTFNGAATTPKVVSTTTNTVVTLERTELLAPKSTNSYEITFSDNATPPNTTTSKVTFVVANYPSLTLPTPIWLETFESAAEGSVPAGWTLSNLSTGGSGTFDLDDPSSDAYMDWVLISKERVQSIGAAGKWGADRRLSVSEAYVNGAKITDLAVGKFLYAESDVRGGNQIQYAFSPDVDLTGKKDIFLSFHSIYEQNQDNIGSVEYSIDQGATWLPIVYMIDGPDIKKDADGNVDAVATLTDANGDAAAYEDPITGEALGKNYGAFIGVAKSEWASLAPFIQARINDDPVESKRVELFRLPKADDQSKVRLRFAQAGTGSWYFGIDNVGFYSITQVAPPQFTAQPGAATIVVGQNGRLTATVTGAGVSLQWRLNGNPIVGATNATLTLSAVTAAQGGTYTLVATNAGGSVTSDAVVVTVPEALKDLSPIRSGLLAYLPFDGNASDLSGLGNNGTPVGAPTFAAGKVGSGALAFGSAKDGSSFNYVTLGTNLVTGTNSFSVAFWAKLDAWTGDPAFIGNKDWNSGGNVGWVAATAGDGRIQWNFRSKGDPQPARRDYDSPGGYFNGAVWRHIVVTFDVNGKASTYVNGDLVDSRDVGPAGSGPDSGLPINIGQDGKGTYTDGNSVSGQGLIDEVALWGRVISPVEAASLYQGGNSGSALVVPAVVTGQWDFNGNLDATVGTALQYFGDTASITAFEDATIGGKPAKVMSFGAATKTQGYIMTHGAGANGGGTKVNQYTLIMDVMFPAASDGKWRGLLQTEPSNANDGDLFVNGANGIGISGQYQGKVVADTWHRLAFAFNLNDKSVSKYIDGVLVNKQTLGEGFDGRWALGSTALLFTDEDNETAAGLVNSVQIRSGTLSEAEIAALGGATAEGIPGVASTGIQIAGISASGANVVITWAGGAGIKLQSAAALGGAWTDVAGSDGASTATVPAANAAAFFRLVK
jgi:hypothetical protein